MLEIFPIFNQSRVITHSLTDMVENENSESEPVPHQSGHLQS